MGSKAGSSIGVFLMSMPVSAMLLMAVFGVPRFAPGVSGESSWQSARQFFTSLGDNASAAPTESPFPQGEFSRNGVPSSTADSEAPRWGGAQAAVDPGRDAASWPFATRDPAASNNSSAASETAEGHPLVARSAGNAPSTARISWRDARRRLAELEIDRFHLEPGLAGDQFLFVCLLSPGGDARVTQRFEAEAADPLVAVEQVLQQVETWLAQQYQRQSSTVGSPFGAR